MTLQALDLLLSPVWHPCVTEGMCGNRPGRGYPGGKRCELTNLASGNETVTSPHQHRSQSHQTEVPQTLIWRQGLSFCLWVPKIFFKKIKKKTNIISNKRAGTSKGNLRDLDYFSAFQVNTSFFIKVLNRDVSFQRKSIFIKTTHLGIQIMYFKLRCYYFKKRVSD